MKRSAGKATWPGRKQVWRVVDDDVAAHDVIGFEADATPQNGIALLEPVMRNGRRELARSLDKARQHRAEMVRLMPAAFRALSAPVDYRVERTPLLNQALG